MEGLALRRRLFGFSSEDVLKLLADREKMFTQANGRALAAEENLAELQAEIGSLREERASKDEELGSLRTEMEELSARLATMQEQATDLEEFRQQLAEMRNDPLSQLMAGDVTFKFLVTEVAPVLKAAEESAAAMLEGARLESERRLEETERAREDVERQVEWLMAWGRRLPPLIRAVQERLSETRRRIEEIPDRVREALRPVTESMMSANEEIDHLANLSNPPTMSPPEPIEDAEQPQAQPVGETYIDLSGWPAESVSEEGAAPEPAWWGGPGG
jgi:predicted  nucleic acid-binding Zn-ribbon protein